MFVTYLVRLTGISEMLWHRDNLEFDPFVQAWQKTNKDVPKGDDRYPAWKWIGCLYHNNKIIGVNAPEILAANLSEGGKGVTLQGKKTFKEPAQTSVEYLDEFVPLKLGGKELSMSPFVSLYKGDEQDILRHQEVAAEAGFSLDIRRVRVGASKHVRVRPRFPAGWTKEFKIRVDDSVISKENLEKVYYIAGNKKGLGEWRPGSPKPGNFGRYEVKLKRIKE